MRQSIVVAFLMTTLSLPSVANAFTKLHNRGGPMLTRPEIAPVFIGDWDRDSVNSTQAYLQSVVDYLNGHGAPRGREQVLRQYGVVGASLLPAQPIALFDGGVTFGRDDVPGIISDAQNYFGAYGYAPGRIVLALTRGYTFNFGSDTAAFHNNDGGDRIYAIVPTDPSDPIGLQLLASHELFEAATDPYPENGVFQDQAWVYDTQSVCPPIVGCIELSTAEGGDECEGIPVPIPGGGIIQAFADNTFGKCSGWAAAAQLIAGDFNNDKLTDVALVGGPSGINAFAPSRPGALPAFDLVPIATSRGDGTYNVLTKSTPGIASYAMQDNVNVLAGDFDGDGATDIAMVSGVGWESVPVAFSKKDGTFRITNFAIDQFAEWAALPNVQAIVGDFDGDRRADIALTGNPNWNTVPIAFSNGDGTFRVTNNEAPIWAMAAAQPGATVLAGKFALNGRAGLAILGVPQWGFVAFLDFDGNTWAGPRFVWDQQFASWASLPGVKPLSADVNQDGFSDILLVGGPNWQTMPVGYSLWTDQGQSFIVDNIWAPDVAWWTTNPSVKAVAGDRFSAKTGGVVLAGGWTWDTVPMALATTRTATVFNNSAGGFSTWAR